MSHPAGTTTEEEEEEEEEQKLVFISRLTRRPGLRPLESGLRLRIAGCEDSGTGAGSGTQVTRIRGTWRESLEGLRWVG